MISRNTVGSSIVLGIWKSRRDVKPPTRGNGEMRKFFFVNFICERLSLEVSRYYQPSRNVNINALVTSARGRKWDSLNGERLAKTRTREHLNFDSRVNTN